MITEMSEGDDDAVVAISYLFDDAAQIDATNRFLTSPGHHLLVAFENAVALGFVTGVQMTHPDKGTEMFLYELGVDESARSKGVGTALVAALADLARRAGCYGMWVLTRSRQRGSNARVPSRRRGRTATAHHALVDL